MYFLHVERRVRDLTQLVNADTTWSCVTFIRFSRVFYISERAVVLKRITLFSRSFCLFKKWHCKFVSFQTSLYHTGRDVWTPMCKSLLFKLKFRKICTMTYIFFIPHFFLMCLLKFSGNATHDNRHANSCDIGHEET